MSNDAIREHFAGMLLFLGNNGLREQVRSWVRSDLENLPITGKQLADALPAEFRSQFQSSMPMGNSGIFDEMATFLPVFFDRITPNGTLPEDGELVKILDECGIKATVK